MRYRIHIGIRVAVISRGRLYKFNKYLAEDIPDISEFAQYGIEAVFIWDMKLNRRVGP